MELIYYRGLNCHLACVVSIAQALGAEICHAYAALWSETEFSDQTKYQIYVSKRVFTNLAALGIVHEVTLDRQVIRLCESELREGELFVAGMDSFYIPWHPVYQTIHDSHYFFVQKQGSYLCYDPVYGMKDIEIEPDALFPHMYEMNRFTTVPAEPPRGGLRQEAEKVLRGHPAMSAELPAEISRCAGEGRGSLPTVHKQINALINNRYLFRHYLEAVLLPEEVFFSEAFFQQWEAVRNGLYKASIVRDNAGVLEEVCGLLERLLREEMAMAERVLQHP